MNKETVDILLSTYNGEKFLKEQIESILSQSYHNYKIIIRDDGSNDSTISILEKLSSHENITIVKDKLGRLGPARSFLQLLEHSSSRYIMFCDQDDVWNKEKIALSLYEIKKNEGDKPCLVHSDMTVVTENLRIIAKSFIQKSKYQRTPRYSDRLIQNNVTGCTVIINRELKNLALSQVPNSLVMHDWWLALIADLYGKVVYIDKPTLLYRQHASNVVGYKPLLSKIYRLIINHKKVIDEYRHTVTQAESLHSFIHTEKKQKLQPDTKKLVYLDLFINYCQSTGWRRVKFIFDRNFRATPGTRNIAYKILFFFIKR